MYIHPLIFSYELYKSSEVFKCGGIQYLFPRRLNVLLALSHDCKNQSKDHIELSL